MAGTSYEEELAHLRRVTEDLSDVVAKQAGQIDQLTRRVEMLLRRAAEMEDASPGGVVIGDERPPHY